MTFNKSFVNSTTDLISPAKRHTLLINSVAIYEALGLAVFEWQFYFIYRILRGRIKGQKCTLFAIKYSWGVKCTLFGQTVLYETSKLNKVQLCMELCKQPHLEGVNIPAHWDCNWIIRLAFSTNQQWRTGYLRVFLKRTRGITPELQLQALLKCMPMHTRGNTVPSRGNVALARNIFLVTRTSTTRTRYLPSRVYKLLNQKWLYA